MAAQNVPQLDYSVLSLEVNRIQQAPLKHPLNASIWLPAYLPLSSHIVGPLPLPFVIVSLTDCRVQIQSIPCDLLRLAVRDPCTSVCMFVKSS